MTKEQTRVVVLLLILLGLEMVLQPGIMTFFSGVWTAMQTGLRNAIQAPLLAAYNAANPGYMPATGLTPGGIAGVAGTGQPGTVNASPAPKAGWSSGVAGPVNASPAPKGGWAPH